MIAQSYEDAQGGVLADQSSSAYSGALAFDTATENPAGQAVYEGDTMAIVPRAAAIPTPTLVPTPTPVPTVTASLDDQARAAGNTIYATPDGQGGLTNHYLTPITTDTSTVAAPAGSTDTSTTTTQSGSSGGVNASATDDATKTLLAFLASTLGNPQPVQATMAPVDFTPLATDATGGATSAASPVRGVIYILIAAAIVGGAVYWYRHRG